MLSLYLFFLSFRAWPQASKHKFRSFSCKSVFVFLSARNPGPCVSGSVYSTFKKTLLEAGGTRGLESDGSPPQPFVLLGTDRTALQGSPRHAGGLLGWEQSNPFFSGSSLQPSSPVPPLQAARVTGLTWKPDHSVLFPKIHNVFFFISR